MLLTSHYGPRQGIFQPMESFKSANWRSSITGIVTVTDGKNYYRAADTRVLVPPNSFPARSLTKKQNYRHIPSTSLVQISKASLHSLHCQSEHHESKLSASCPTSPSTPPSIPNPSSTPPPNLSSPRPPRPPSSSPRKPSPSPLPSPSPRSNPSPSPKSTPPNTASEAKLKRSYTPHKPLGLKGTSFDQFQSCSIISRSVEMHERTPQKSYHQGIYNSPAFPYPNPNRVQGTFSSRLAFTSRLSELTRLQTETVRQECCGVGGARRPMSASTAAASTTSLPSQQSKMQQQQHSTSSSVSERPRRSAKRNSSGRPRSAGRSNSLSTLDPSNKKRGHKRSSGGKGSRRRGSSSHISSQSVPKTGQNEKNCDGLERQVQSMCILEDTAVSAVTSRQHQSQEEGTERDEKEGAHEEGTGGTQEEGGGGTGEEGGAQGGGREKKVVTAKKKTRRKGKQIPFSSSSSSLTSLTKQLKKQHTSKIAMTNLL